MIHNREIELGLPCDERTRTALQLAYTWNPARRRTDPATVCVDVTMGVSIRVTDAAELVSVSATSVTFTAEKWSGKVELWVWPVLPLARHINQWAFDYLEKDQGFLIELLGGSYSPMPFNGGLTDGDG